MARLERLFGSKPRTAVNRGITSEALVKSSADQSTIECSATDSTNASGVTPAEREPSVAPHEPTVWGPDGWPANTVVHPPACPKCGSRDFWLPITGQSTTQFPQPWRPEEPRWRCATCDPPRTADRIRAAVERIRRQSQSYARRPNRRTNRSEESTQVVSEASQYRDQDGRKAEETQAG